MIRDQGANAADKIEADMFGGNELSPNEASIKARAELGKINRCFRESVKKVLEKDGGTGRQLGVVRVPCPIGSGIE